MVHTLAVTGKYLRFVVLPAATLGYLLLIPLLAIVAAATTARAPKIHFER